MSSRGEREDPVPDQLKQIVELVRTVEARLEECAVEWQSSVSKRQWRIVEASTPDSWERSLLARTYFSDRALDEAFQSLLSKENIFTEQLNHFVALLRGDEVSLRTHSSNVRDAENQCPEAGENVDKYRLEGQCRKRSNQSVSSQPLVSSIQRCFADLVKAKIDLDTKFLGFEAILNSTANKPAAARPDQACPSCLCQICSNVLGNAVEESKALPGIATSKQKFPKITRARQKRLQRSTRTLPRRKAQTRGRSKESKLVTEKTPVSPLTTLSTHRRPSESNF